MVDFSRFVSRRQRVQQEMRHGVLVLFAATEQIRNNDVTREFRQDSDFYYLTGFDEPDAALVVIAGDAPRSVLFVNPKDPEREVWDGIRLGVAGAKVLGADEVYPIGELTDQLPKLLSNQRQVWCRFGSQPVVDPRIDAALAVARQKGRRGAGFPTVLSDLATLVHEMRRRKERTEVVAMERAIGISAEAHLAAMASTAPGMYEYQVEALLRSTFRRAGSERVAYEPIVGSGANATVLHYVKNQSQMADGDLLLIDAGCEYDYYAADITRTFPVNGRFTPAQREVYDLVLAAQEASIAVVAPGATLEDVHRAGLQVICQGLVDLGVLQGDAVSVEEEASYRPFFMHKTSHYLGMDVHDVGAYFDAGKPRPLDAGVVITVEPGLYFGADGPASAAKYRGIGVRIEDDVLVESHGATIMSAGVPKAPRDVERACGA